MGYTRRGIQYLWENKNKQTFNATQNPVNQKRQIHESQLVFLFLTINRGLGKTVQKRGKIETETEMKKSKRSKGQFIDKAQGHCGVLPHMVKAQILDLVIGRVNLLVGVFHFTFNCHRSGISLPAGRGVVGAGITTFGLHERNLTVLYICQSKHSRKSRCDWLQLTSVITSLMNLVSSVSTKSTTTAIASSLPASSVPWT